jgi:hypothetical protein
MTTEYKEPTGLLHIYSQSAWHEDAYIVGNRESLEELKKLIDKALETGKGDGDFWVNDGEGYPLHVIFVDGDWHTDKWVKLITTYTESIANDNNRVTIKPYEL